MNRSKLGVVTGLQAEARWLKQAGFMVRPGGGTPAGAKAAAYALVEQGAEALLSFGLAGGLQPGLRPGTILVPSNIVTATGHYGCDPALLAFLGGATPQALWAGNAIAATTLEKAQLYQRYQTAAIDLESGSVAEVATQHALPFAVLRAVTDPAERTLPPAALVALKADGSLDVIRLLHAVITQPGQIRELILVGQDAKVARQALLARLKSLP